MKKKGKKRIINVSVALIINEQGKILFTQRYNPTSSEVNDKWQLPGGTVEYGEHPIETLRREIKEEVNLTIQPLTHYPAVVTHIYPHDPTQIILFVYPATIISGTLSFKNDPYTKDARWYNYNEINFSNCLPKLEEILSLCKTFIASPYTII